MAPEKRVIVAHPSGEEYSVTPSAFRRLYEPRGFTVVRNEDGSEYSPPKATERKATPLHEARQKAKDRGLSAGGSIAAILARVADHDGVPDSPAPAGEDTAPA